MEPILTTTPLQRLPFLDDAAGNRFWIKRDDLLPFSFGGNKVRIGMAFLEDCLQKGCDAMILYGDRRSNLCRVLAGLCAARKIPCLMIATTEHAQEGATPLNERMIRKLGVRILPCEKTDIAGTVDRAFALFEQEGRKPYYIYGNRLGEGNEAVAVSAYVRAARELLAQEAKLEEPFTHVYVPCGTGSTLSGLAVGLCEGKSSAQVVGISISSRSEERAVSCVRRSIAAWYGEQETRMIPLALQRQLRLECGYNCGGYGEKDARVRALIDQVFLASSIPLDETYTGKAMRGMLDDLKKNKICNANVLFLHTGGTPLFFDALAASGPTTA